MELIFSIPLLLVDVEFFFFLLYFLHILVLLSGKHLFLNLQSKYFLFINASIIIPLLLNSLNPLFITLFCMEIVFLLCVFNFVFFMVPLFLSSLKFFSSNKTKLLNSSTFLSFQFVLFPLF